VLIQKSSSGVTVNNARVVLADVLATNGVVHVIDQVLSLPSRTSSVQIAMPSAMSAAEVVSTIKAAIKKGAPLYNRDDFWGCYQAYLAGANQIVNSNAFGSADLRKAISKSSNETPKNGAWTIRYAFDKIISSAASSPPVPPSTIKSVSATGFTVDATALSWEVVNDSVMGGISRSTIQTRGSGTSAYKYFSGYATTDRNGGFASVRSYGHKTDFSNCRGIQIEVKGDGQTYGFEIRNSGNYEYAFVPTNTWTTIDIPFSSMVSTWMGRAIRGSVTDKTVYSFGLKRSAFTGGAKAGSFISGDFSVQLKTMRCLL